jgi:hypothetical protein
MKNSDVTNCYKYQPLVVALSGMDQNTFLIGAKLAVAASVKPFCTYSPLVKGCPVPEFSLEIQNLTFAAASFPNLFC